MVMDGLRQIDSVAYIRFASVYRDFTDITDLKQEIDTLVDGSEAIHASEQLPLLPDEKPKELAKGRQRRRR